MADPPNIPSPAPPATPRPPETAPQAAPEHAEAEVAVRSRTQEALRELRDRIDEDNTQFSAPGLRQRIESEIETFLKANENSGPENFQAEWRKAVVDKAAELLAEWDNYFDTLEVEETNKLLPLIKDPEKGVGYFESWFQKKHPTEYKAWKGEKAEAERKRQEAEKAAQEAAQQRQEAERQRQETERQRQEAEQKRQADERQRQEQAGLEAAEEADAPFLDRLNTTVAGMEEGKWKTIATKLVAAFTGLFVMLSKAPLIGGWVRRNFISNKTLARLGDKNAEAALKTEEQFRKLGLSRDLANELGGKKTKDVVALIKDPQKLTNLTTDTAVQGKLTTLANQLADHGGAASEVTLFEFMGNNPNWPGVAVAAAAAPAAAAATTAGAAPAPETAAPAPPPPAATAAPAAPAAPGAPAEAAPNLQNQFIARINDQLKPYQGRTTDLTKGRVEFQLPFISNGRLDEVRCVISGNMFEIGAHKYRMNLPHNANLKSITIEGGAPSGTATLVAGKWGLSDGRELPLQEMLGHLEAIRQGPQTHQASIGTDTATFTKIG